jgi:hypothetical protein
VELFLLLIVLIGGLILLDTAAVTWGWDSREPITDDHRR